MDTWYIDETFNKDGTTTFCAVLFDSSKAKLIKSKINKVIKKRINNPSNKMRQLLLSEAKLSYLKRLNNNKLTNDLITLIHLTAINVIYKTIKCQKANHERKLYIQLYSDFVKTLGDDYPIVIDRCDTNLFSDAIVNATGMNNVSWINSSTHIGIQMADILLAEKT